MQDYNALVTFLKSQSGQFFIEIEGKPNAINKFILKYNSSHSSIINNSSDGIVQLEENANKWGLECRLYVKDCSVFDGFTHNTVYRPEYRYRLNDNNIVRRLLDDGFQVGLN